MVVSTRVGKSISLSHTQRDRERDRERDRDRVFIQKGMLTLLRERKFVTCHDIDTPGGHSASKISQTQNYCVVLLCTVHECEVMVERWEETLRGLSGDTKSQIYRVNKPRGLPM